MSKNLCARSLTGIMIGLVSFAVVACNDNPTPNPSPSPSTTQTGSGHSGPPAVLTQHNDLARDGANLNETILTRSNVNASTFGKIGALPVDGVVYAQPLYVPNVNISGTVHNIVYVATENDSVYAYDADTLSTTPLWQRVLTGDSLWTCPFPPCSVPTAVQMGFPNISPIVGITATPVIDQANGVIYVTAFTLENTFFRWRLHALSLATGAEMPGSPVTIDGDYPGTGEGANNDGLIYFNTSHHLSRSGLVLNNGLVYIAFSSMDDQTPTHGWLFAFDAATLLPVSTYMTSPNTGEDNIWMAGTAMAVDSNGSMYFSTSNGDPAYNAVAGDLATSVVKLAFGQDGFQLQDYFTPYNHQTLTDLDVEVGSGGVTLLPDQAGAHVHEMVVAGKQGTIYLLDRDNLGKITTAANPTSDPQIVQEFQGILPGGTSDGNGVYGAMAYYKNNLYVVGSGDFLRSIPISNGLLDWASMKQSNVKDTVRGATPSISANGNSNGIVWYMDASAYTYSWNPSVGGYPTIRTNGPVILYAFSTDDVTAPLYSSNSVSSDAAGDAVKFAVPTVVAGKVFVGTQSELSVYGLRSDIASNKQFQSGDREIASVKPKPQKTFPLAGFRAENSCELHPVRKGGAEMF